MNIKSILFFICITSFLHFSQLFGQSKNSDPDKKTAVIENTILFSDQEIANAGVAILSDFRMLSNSDISLILNFDYTKYRNFNSRKKVQIENGPLIELFSLQEMILKGEKIDAKLLNEKRDADSSITIHEVIVMINIGLGLTNTVELH